MEQISLCPISECIFIFSFTEVKLSLLFQQGFYSIRGVCAYGSGSEKYMVKTASFHPNLSSSITDASMALSGPMSDPLFLAEQGKE